jgi:hypothetical protein
MPIQYINCEQLIYVLTDSVKFTKRFLTSIRAGINELVNLGLINFENVISCDSFIIDLSPLYFSTSKADNPENQTYYVMITQDEVKKCVNGKSTYKFKLLRYFAYMIGSFRGDIGFCSMDEIAYGFNCTNKTINNNNKILEKLELLYIYRSSDYIRDSVNDITTSITNTYGRYCDKDKVIQAAIDYENNYGYKTKMLKSKVTREKSNQCKSYLMRYYSFKNGKEYDNKELKEIYLGMIDYNNRYSNKRQDLHIFKDYDFYIDSG